MSELTSIYLGNILKRIREEKTGLSQVSFAKFLNISKSLVCRVESGERKYNNLLLEEIFDKLNLDSYDRMKILLLSNLNFKIKNTLEDKSNVLKLVIELKNNNLIEMTKSLIHKALDVFDTSVDFYVLLSTINLIEKKYDESIKNIEIALELYKSGKQSISTDIEIYHNYGNIYFHMSYEHELKKIKIISDLFNKGLSKKEIIKNIEYKNITKEIYSLYEKTESLMLKSYSFNHNHKEVSAQLSRLYFNMSNINESYIEKSINFITKFLREDNIKKEDRIEISILLSLLMSLNKQYDYSHILLNNIIALDPNNCLAIFVKSINYSLEGKISESLKNLDYLLSIDNSDDLKLQIAGEINFSNIFENEKYRKEIYKLLSK